MQYTFALSSVRRDDKGATRVETQTLTQTINIIIGGDGTNGSLANTGASLGILTALALALIAISVLAWRFASRRSLHSKLNFRSLGVFAFLAFGAAGLIFNLSGVAAAPTLTLGADQNTLTVTVPEGGGTAESTTTITSDTVNATGYTLTAALAEAEPGIDIKLKGGDVSSSTALTPGAPALTLKTTDSASSNDTTEVTLNFTIDSTVTPGTKELKLAYTATDNESESGATLQGFTASQCSALTTYDGSNEEAIITLTDSRADNQTYQVAKLADGHCWMLDNLKLGSTTGTITLTPSDTNIAANFTLPQLTTSGIADYDNPGVYGPIPGDGAGVLQIYTDGNYSTGGTWSLVITAPISATVGPFPYDVDGDTVAAALQAAVGEAVTTNNSGTVENYGKTIFSWASLTDAWDISINLSDIVQDNGPGLYDATVAKEQSYGYLYNWSAATAGESRTSHDETAGDAPYSICPAGWRLPTGGYDTDTGVPLPTNEFNELSARMAGFPNGQDSTYLDNYWDYYQGWQNDGAFKGVFAGYWWEGFAGQGDNGGLWSSSAHPDGVDGAFNAYFGSGNVYPTNYNDRAYGMSVRCLLN